MKPISKFLLLLCLVNLSAPIQAHSYFFGLTEFSINNKTKKLEIIHQFNDHHLENAIAEQRQVNFSPEHPHYENFIRHYFEENFSLLYNGLRVKTNWVGIEISHGNIIVYQEIASEKFLPGLVVKNSLLIDTYVKQINTLNYQYADHKKSLTFSSAKQILEIESSNMNIKGL